MKAKVLKHRRVKDLYGVLVDNQIHTSDLPVLLPITATKELLISQIRKINGSLAAQVSSDYDLVEIELFEVPDKEKRKISEQY